MFCREEVGLASDAKKRAGADHFPLVLGNYAVDGSEGGLRVRCHRVGNAFISCFFSKSLISLKGHLLGCERRRATPLRASLPGCAA